MKRLALITLTLLLTFTAPCFAVDLVCDPQDSVTVYGLKWTPTDIWEEVAAMADTTIEYDLGVLAPGNYPNAEIRAGREYLLDGQPTGAYVWGLSRPFALRKPAIPDEVAGIGLKIEAPL